MAGWEAGDMLTTGIALTHPQVGPNEVDLVDSMLLTLSIE